MFFVDLVVEVYLALVRFLWVGYGVFDVFDRLGFLGLWWSILVSCV